MNNTTSRKGLVVPYASATSMGEIMSRCTFERESLSLNENIKGMSRPSRNQGVGLLRRKSHDPVIPVGIEFIFKLQDKSL